MLATGDRRNQSSKTSLKQAHENGKGELLKTKRKEQHPKRAIKFYLHYFIHAYV